MALKVVAKYNGYTLEIDDALLINQSNIVVYPTEIKLETYSNATIKGITITLEKHLIEEETTIGVQR